MATRTRTRDKSPVPEVKLTREVKLAVKWKELALKITEVIAQGFLTAFGGDGLSGGVSALVGAVGTIQVEAEPGEKAWSLAVLCFAWALDELKALPGTDLPALRKEMQAALAEAKNAVDAGNEYVPITFLERPTTLPLYRALRDALVARRSIFRSGINESEQVLVSRFDAAYDRAMFEVLSRRLDVYKSLLPVFSLPGVSAAERQINWVAYRKQLVFDFEVKAVFGQENTKLSLSQLYVPLRGCWPKNDRPSEEGPRVSPSFTQNVIMLDDELDKWIQIASDDDNVRLIGGGPGSGKSTTLRALARRMADRDDWRPLLIPLQYIDLGGDFRDAINSYFVNRTSGSFTQPPLSRSAIEDGPPLLLIFDGLDELARPGEGANEVVNLFSIKLATLLSALRGDGYRCVKALVSGRMPSFQAAKRYISPPVEGCLEVYGFRPASIVIGKADELWSLDQRATWWRQYATLVGASLDLPPAFVSKELEEVTHEPLLCYLLVLSGFATSNWEQAAENPNRIYKTLIDSIWDRGWGEGSVKRQGPGRTLSRGDFNTLMQTIALAAWQGGDTRVATEQGFLSAIKVAQAERAWESFKDDNGADITNLAMNFYLKGSESMQRGFEFTHKSFGDYLAARAILDISEDLPSIVNRKIDHAMTDWIGATGTGALSAEMLTFLRDEVRLRTTERIVGDDLTKIVDLKRAFERLVNTILFDGLPVLNTASTWRIAEARQRNGEMMAWAVLNSLSLVLARYDRPEKMIHVEWPDKNASFAQLLRRISDRAGPYQSPVLTCFSYLEAPGANLFGLALSGIDLRGAEMSKSVFNGCHLIGANFEGANLDGCFFQRAMLDQAKLKDASLKGADLVDARLEKADIGSAVLDGAIVSEVSLLYADLQALTPHLRSLRFRGTFFFDRIARVGKQSDKWDIYTRVPEIRKLIGSMSPDKNPY